MQLSHAVLISSPHTDAAIVCARSLRRFRGATTLATLFTLTMSFAYAQTTAIAALPVASAVRSAESKVEAKPLWKELTATQQQALKPLEPRWNSTSEPQKRKWLALSLNFAKMSPTEQANLHERMLDWGALSAAQRSQARLNFSETKRLTSEEKHAKWEAYQTLGPEEKEKLAKSVRLKLPGAATALKLVPAQKLATVPPSRKDETKGPSIAAAPHQINPKTLLPLEPQRMTANGTSMPGSARPVSQ